MLLPMGVKPVSSAHKTYVLSHKLWVHQAVSGCKRYFSVMFVQLSKTSTANKNASPILMHLEFEDARPNLTFSLDVRCITSNA